MAQTMVVSCLYRVMDFALRLVKKETQSIMKRRGVCNIKLQTMKWYTILFLYVNDMFSCIAEYCEDTNPMGPNDYRIINGESTKF